MFEVVDAYFHKDGYKYRNVKFNIVPGKVTALLAPNGAGKTTLLKCLAGDWVADARACMRVNDALVPRRSLAARKSAFYADGERRLLYPARTCRWHLEMIKSIWPGNVSIEQAAQACKLTSYLDKRVSQLSKGMAQKLVFGLALLSGAPYVLLDEPEDGLDADNRDLLLGLVRQMAASGVGLLIATHDLILASHCDAVQFLTKDGCIERREDLSPEAVASYFRELYL